MSNATYQQANQRQPPRKEEVKEPSPGARVPSPAVLKPGAPALRWAGHRAGVWGSPLQGAPHHPSHAGCGCVPGMGISPLTHCILEG